MTTKKNSDPTFPEEKKFFWLTVLYVVLLLVIVVIISVVIWGKDYIIMHVPVAILEWGFVGGMVAVLYRLAYQKKIWTSDLGLYTWVIAKPIIGLVMGALVYFVALGGGKLLGAPADALKGEQVYWLNVIAFIGGFSDELSIGLINRIVAQTLGRESGKDEA